MQQQGTRGIAKYALFLPPWRFLSRLHGRWCRADAALLLLERANLGAVGLAVDLRLPRGFVCQAEGEGTPTAHAVCASPRNICKHIDDCLQRTSPQGTKVIATYVSPNGAMLLNTYVPQRFRRPSTTYWTASGNADRVIPSCASSQSPMRATPHRIAGGLL